MYHGPDKQKQNHFRLRLGTEENEKPRMFNTRSRAQLQTTLTSTAQVVEIPRTTAFNTERTAPTATDVSVSGSNGSGNGGLTTLERVGIVLGIIFGFVTLLIGYLAWRWAGHRYR
ncbi:hypothetical protein K440DRAFT_263051 [Wilcoxina mikolae CBS 423.85]|nr:hypothetical protein K440DRAFT_263051 [Wilcoxina mikolae CBS 423.85]